MGMGGPMVGGKLPLSYTPCVRIGHGDETRGQADRIATDKREFFVPGMDDVYPALHCRRVAASDTRWFAFGFLVMAVALAGCAGEDGKDGRDGTNGSNGATGPWSSRHRHLHGLPR